MRELRTVDRALAVLDLIADGGDADLGLAEIALRAGLAKATTLRMLGALQKRGYITKATGDGRYSLGPRILSLAASLRPRLRALARPVLERIVQETGETAVLYLLDGIERVCAEEVSSPQPVRVTFEIGSRAPLHAGASGKVLLAFISDTDRRQLRSGLQLERYTAATPQTWDALEQELGEIHRVGYAMSQGEHDAGVFGISAPILGQSGRLEGALSVVGPISRWSPETRDRCLASVLTSSIQLGRTLGHVHQTPSTPTAAS